MGRALNIAPQHKNRAPSHLLDLRAVVVRARLPQLEILLEDLLDVDHDGGVLIVEAGGGCQIREGLLGQSDCGAPVFQDLVLEDRVVQCEPETPGVAVAEATRGQRHRLTVRALRLLHGAGALIRRAELREVAAVVAHELQVEHLALDVRVGRLPGEFRQNLEHAFAALRQLFLQLTVVLHNPRQDVQGSAHLAQSQAASIHGLLEGLGEHVPLDRVQLLGDLRHTAHVFPHVVPALRLLGDLSHEKEVGARGGHPA
mmetsp:Transcript_65079/g.187274  ORF Transcript_65079/g.187274 Transcript_65079/m.187274 type:complete len:257 (+) Transcript_65079:90-860(+)